jgi:hypothetical protein
MTSLNTRQLAVRIDGVHTDVVVSDIGDTLFIIITQRDKIGHLFECSCDGGDTAESQTFTVNTLLGSRSDESVETIFARQIVQLVANHAPQKKVILGMALKDRQPPPSTLAGVLAVLGANSSMWKVDDHLELID